VNQIEGLKKFQQEKRVNTIERVKEAISTLKASNRSVNFKSVSKVSGITRKTLYKVPEIREMIEKLRDDSIISSHILNKLQKQNQILKNENKNLKSIIYELKNIIKS